MEKYDVDIEGGYIRVYVPLGDSYVDLKPHEALGLVSQLLKAVETTKEDHQHIVFFNDGTVGLRGTGYIPTPRGES